VSVIAKLHMELHQGLRHFGSISPMWIMTTHRQQ
jgi:hypothetical protein